MARIESLDHIGSDLISDVIPGSFFYPDRYEDLFLSYGPFGIAGPDAQLEKLVIPEDDLPPRCDFKMDVHHTDGEYTVEAELPGVAKEEIGLHAEGGRLTISVNKAEEGADGSRRYLHRECNRRYLSRSFRLRGADLDAISAKLDGGVLRVTVPKKQSRRESKEISIE